MMQRLRVQRTYPVREQTRESFFCSEHRSAMTHEGGEKHRRHTCAGRHGQLRQATSITRHAFVQSLPVYVRTPYDNSVSDNPQRFFPHESKGNVHPLCKISRRCPSRFAPSHAGTCGIQGDSLYHTIITSAGRRDFYRKNDGNKKRRNRLPMTLLRENLYTYHNTF